MSAKPHKYKWLRHEGQLLYQVGILEDGALHNPRGYPEDLVRAAVLAAIREDHERRSEAAKQAAITRRKRRARMVYAIAKRLTLNDQPIGPRSNCMICGKGLSDAESIARGIGSDCWQDVLAALADMQGATS